MENRKITTLFFDFGDTLAEGRPTYIERITEVLAEFGFPRERADVIRAFTKADYLLYLDSRAGSLKTESEYLGRFLDHFGKRLDLTIDWPAVLPEVLGRFDGAFFERRLCEGAAELLEQLAGKGYRLGVISNNDGKCKEKCEQLGIAKYFEVIVDSGVEAVRKPAPEIFEIALERMGVAAREAAHTGDMYGSDVLGARDIGIIPVWFNTHRCQPFDSYEPDYEITRLKQILDFF